MSASKNRTFVKDIVILCLSIMVAVLLVKTGAVAELLGATQNAGIVGSVLAGMLFVSVFTVVPATVALAEIAQSHSIGLVALFGGLGALLGDLIIFRFVRDHIVEDIAYLLRNKRSKRIRAVFRLRFFQWLIPFFGALVVASPLPDEIGLTMMGLYKVNTRTFALISFFLNSVGIYIIGMIARTV